MSRLGALHLTKPTGGKHTATVIFFHGSGGNGQALKEFVDIVARKFVFNHIKVLYPTAPLQPYTLNMGCMSNVWFDRTALHPQAKEVLPSLAKIEDCVKNLIKQENDARIPNNRIIVGGFSMGGGLALHTAYRWAPDLAGVFAFSSFLSEDSIVYEELEKGTNRQLPPLLQFHGDCDDMVDLSWGRATFERLQGAGVKGQFHLLGNLGHDLNRQGLAITKDWIEKLLPEIN